MWIIRCYFHATWDVYTRKATKAFQVNSVFDICEEPSVSTLQVTNANEDSEKNQWGRVMRTFIISAGQKESVERINSKSHAGFMKRSFLRARSRWQLFFSPVILKWKAHSISSTGSRGFLIFLRKRYFDHTSVASRRNALWPRDDVRDILSKSGWSKKIDVEGDGMRTETN